jgi:hypothetical protein
MNDGHDGDDDGPAVKAHTAQASSTHRHKDKHKYIKYIYNPTTPANATSASPWPAPYTVARKTYLHVLAGWLAGWLGSACVCVRRAFIPPADQTRPDHDATGEGMPGQA